MYAWTNFTTETNEWGQVTKSINVGDEITQERLGVSDEHWDNLIEGGQVREQPYPETPSGVSPSDYFKHLQAKAARGKLTAKEVSVLQQRPAPRPEPKITHDEGLEPGANRTVEAEFKLPI